MTSKRLRLIAAAVAVGAFALAAVLLVDTHGLLAEVQARQGALAAWVQAHPWLSPGIFLVCAMLGTLTPVPGGLLIMLTGGFLFGPIGGGLLSAVGVVCSAGLVCLAGRRLFAAPIEQALVRRRAGAIEALSSDAFHYLLALRLLPGMPAWLTNLLPVPLPIPLRTVLVATSLGILPVCLIVATIGNGVATLGIERQALSAEMMLRAQYLVPLIGLAMLAILAPVIKIMRKPNG